MSEINRDELQYRATLNAIDSVFNPLKIALPLVILAYPIIINLAGFLGLAITGFLAITTLLGANKTARDYQEKIEDGDFTLLLKHTKPQDKKFLKESQTSDSVALLSPSREIVESQEIEIQDSYKPLEFNREKFLESVVGCAILGNSGSGKTVLAVYLSQGFDSPLIVLDCHFDSGDSNWDSNAFVISDKDSILKTMAFLMELIDRKDKRKLMIIIDEFPALRIFEKQSRGNTEICDSFLLRYGSESRKYNKLAIFCSQSGNTKSLGLDGMGDFLENFALVRLQKIAIKHAYYKGLKPLYEWLNSTAYPMTIDGIDGYLHPCLGHHQEVIKGNKPINLTATTTTTTLYPDISETLTGIVSQTATTTIKSGEFNDSNSGDNTATTTATTIKECPHCESKNIKRNGMNRMLCKDCGKTFKGK